MLVLTRRTGEEIIIGGDIRITIVSVKGDRVRIGVTAPDSVTVDRAEVHQRRMQFVDVPVSALHDADTSIRLGETMRAPSADDTASH